MSSKKRWTVHFSCESDRFVVFKILRDTLNMLKCHRNFRKPTMPHNCLMSTRAHYLNQASVIQPGAVLPRSKLPGIIHRQLLRAEEQAHHQRQNHPLIVLQQSLNLHKDHGTQLVFVEHPCVKIWYNSGKFHRQASGSVSESPSSGPSSNEREISKLGPKQSLDTGRNDHLSKASLFRLHSDGKNTAPCPRPNH